MFSDIMTGTLTSPLSARCVCVHWLLQEQNFEGKPLRESLQDHHNNVGYRESQKHFLSATCNAVYFCAIG